MSVKGVTISTTVILAVVVALGWWAYTAFSNRLALNEQRLNQQSQQALDTAAAWRRGFEAAQKLSSEARSAAESARNAAAAAQKIARDIDERLGALAPADPRVIPADQNPPGTTWKALYLLADSGRLSERARGDSLAKADSISKRQMPSGGRL